MKFHSFRRTAALIALFGFAAAAGANDQAGTRGFSFLRIGLGARAAGMGEAYTAVADGAEGLFWNPAGAGQINHPQIATNYIHYVADMHAGSIGFAQPAGRFATWNLSLRFLSAGDIPRTTVADPTGAGSGEFSATDLAFGAGLAVRVGDRFFLGANGAVISGGIDGESALGFSGDFGLLVRNAYRRLRLGAAVRNAGTMTSGYLNESDPLPTVVSAGTAYPFFDRRFLLSADWSWAVDWDSRFAVGAEWELVNDFFLRGGYRTHLDDLRDDSTGGDGTGASFGLGFRRVREYQIDYAYASMGDLGGTHRFSIAWVFR